MSRELLTDIFAVELKICGRGKDLTRGEDLLEEGREIVLHHQEKSLGHPPIEGNSQIIPHLRT